MGEGVGPRSPPPFPADPNFFCTCFKLTPAVGWLVACSLPYFPSSFLPPTHPPCHFCTRYGKGTCNKYCWTSMCLQSAAAICWT